MLRERPVSAGNVDRLSIRARPSRLPLGHQTWGKLLFLHWPCSVEAIRSLVPNRLSIDTFEDRAWISVTSFTMWNIRPSFLPPLPFLSRAHELNVRTYVHDGRTPGVWFLSLDINHVLGMLAGRWGFSLPYFRASIDFFQNELFGFSSVRRHSGAPAAEFEVKWRVDPRTWGAEPGTLDFFLVERYCLYSFDGRRLWRGRIWHTPWFLQPATVLSCRCTMLRALGLPAPKDEPLVHYAEEKRVSVYALERVGGV